MTTPIIRGGQGRAPEDLASDAAWLAVWLALALAMAVVALLEFA